MKRIPLAKPDFDSRELEAVRRVLDSRWVVQGPEVEAFEAALAGMHQVQHCVVVSSGTAALHLCYLAMEIGPGDAVFVPSFAWPSAANMAMIVGARPVFVDVLPHTYNMDPDDLRARIGQCLERNWGKPRAIVPVHEFGLAADMDSIGAVAAEYGLDIIEDAACSLGGTHKGRPVGTFGAMAIFSFHPRKAMTTGEGGAIVTNEATLAERCRMLRNHGQTFVDGRRDFTLPGLNYRMTEFQAAIGRVQLEKFESILARRKEAAALYLRRLQGCHQVALPSEDPEHTWQTFMIVIGPAEHERAVQRLGANGIGAAAGSVAGHCADLYASQFGYKPSDLPVSARLASWGLALPLYSTITEGEIECCVGELRAALNG